MGEGKKIVIISGVTGAIGSALFSEYGQEVSNIVYGISRKALDVNKFLRNGKLPQKTFICSIGDSSDYSSLFKNIDFTGINEVIYIHALGLYPFEINKKGEIIVENDLDGDGINDEVTKLTLNYFVSATMNLSKYWQGRTKCIIFGSIADRYHPSAHTSWWKTIEKVKQYMTETADGSKKLSMLLFNISSVLCPHEVITRPFVFTDTDAKQTYWLNPYELASFVIGKTDKTGCGFTEFDKFRIRPGFNVDQYYRDTNFTHQKVKELFR